MRVVFHIYTIPWGLGIVSVNYFKSFFSRRQYCSFCPWKDAQHPARTGSESYSYLLCFHVIRDVLCMSCGRNLMCLTKQIPVKGCFAKSKRLHHLLNIFCVAKERITYACKVRLKRMIAAFRRRCIELAQSNGRVQV